MTMTDDHYACNPADCDAKAAEDDLDQAHARAETAEQERDQLRAEQAAVWHLTQDADGNAINPATTITIGELLKAIHDAESQGTAPGLGSSRRAQDDPGLIGDRPEPAVGPATAQNRPAVLLTLAGHPWGELTVSGPDDGQALMAVGRALADLLAAWTGRSVQAALLPVQDGRHG